MDLLSENELISIILGCDNRYNDLIIPQLEARFFIDKKNALIFSACELIQKKKQGIDNVSVSEILNKNNKLDKSISEHIIKLLDSYISGSNYQFFIDRLIENYKERIIKTIKTSEDFEIAQKELSSIQSTAKIVNIAHKAMDMLFSYYNEDTKRIKTGYNSIDNALGCFMSGDYVLLAGATGSGKTWTMLNLIQNIAKQGNKICIFSLEMSLEQVQNRFACMDLGIDSSKFRKFTFEDREIQNYSEYVDKMLPKYDIDIVCEYNVTVDTIRSVIKKTNYDIVFIDYLGLISGKGTSYEKFSEISRSIKQIALEEKVCIVCLHQINRAYADRQDKRPKLSDLRDSGKIEQDIDSCIFIHKPAYFDPEANPELAEIIIAKNRHGASNKILNYKVDTISQKMREY